jgi:hypothetical protein
MKVTRRSLLSTLPALAAAQAQAQAQAQPAATTERPSRDQDLETARNLIKANTAALAKVKIPGATEPAFLFKA